MGVIDGLLKAGLTATACGYAVHRLSDAWSPILTGCAATAGFVYYLRTWIQDYAWDWSYPHNKDLTGKTVLVTGGTVGGLGFASAEIFAKLGARVIVTVRTDAKGEAAVRALRSSSGAAARGQCSYVLCDFLDSSSIRRCAATVRAMLDGDAGNQHIDFLILNAGIAKSKIPADIWQTNHVGPWLFTEEIEPLLSASDLRIVWVSSGAHKKASIHFENPFDPSRSSALGGGAYGQSKLANILHMREYPKRHAGDVRCFAVTPGFARTRIMTAPLLMKPLLYAISRSPTLGAQVIKMACLDDNLEGGEYLSNCYVKPTEGKDGCSNDAEMSARLWELTAQHVKDEVYAKEKARQTAGLNAPKQRKDK